MSVGASTVQGRTRWIGTSWKMNKTLAEARDYASGLAAALRAEPGLAAGLQPFIIPPHTAIAETSRALSWPQGEGDAGVVLGAQNAHWEESGAWTGEVSVPQVRDAGAQLVEIGHSERREHFGETVETTRWKVQAARRHGLRALLCIGEPGSVRDAGESAAYILDQARGALQGLSQEDLDGVLIAYEPIWAIGENGRPATVEELRKPFRALEAEFGETVEGILYGGSVNLDNAAELLGIDGVDGLFVGRTAWQLEGYLQLLRIAGRQGT